MDAGPDASVAAVDAVDAVVLGTTPEGGTPDAGPTPGLGCPSAASANPGANLAVALVYDLQAIPSLASLRGDGSLAVVAPLPVGASSTLWRQGDLVVVGSNPTADDPQRAYQALMADRAGQVRWRVTRALPAVAYGGGIFIDASGAAAITITRPGVEPRDDAMIVLPDGSSYQIANARPEGPPADDGWFPFSTAVSGIDARKWGFIEYRTGRSQASRYPVLDGAAVMATAGRLLYFTADAVGPALVIEDPAGATRLPLATSVTPFLSLRTTAAGLLITDGDRPRWLLRDLSALLDIGALPGADFNTVAHTYGGLGDWLLVVDQTVSPRWRVQLSTLAVISIEAPSPAPGPAPAPPLPRTSVQAYPRWATGVDRGGRIWRVDLATGVVDYPDPSPLRRFGPPCEGQAPRLLADGTMTLGLRDDSAGALFALAPGGAGWSRIGQPMVNIIDVTGFRIGNSFLLWATGAASYCPTATWAPVPAGAEAPLSGPATEILLPGDQRIVLPAPTDMLFHPSGECALLARRVRNFVTGEEFDVPVSAAAMFWW